VNEYLDHVIWVCDNLERGCRQFRELTGIEPRFGGVHASGLTQNALIGMGGRCYLEILAPVRGPGPNDDDWTRYAHAAKQPHVLTYCMRSPRPLRELAKMAESRGWKNAVIAANGRVRPDGVELKWEWLAPVVEPLGRAFPFFIDWLDSPHPAQFASPAPAPTPTPDAGKIALRHFSVGHPEAAVLAKALQDSGSSVEVFQSPAIRFRVELDTPRGVISL
jgi:hypothetical protein